MTDKTRLPEWAQGTAEEGFASLVMHGVKTRHDGMPGPNDNPEFWLPVCLD